MMYANGGSQYPVLSHLRISSVPSESTGSYTRESTEEEDQDGSMCEDSSPISSQESAMTAAAGREIAQGTISEGRKSEDSTIAITSHDFLPKFLDDGSLSKCITMSDSMPSRNIPMCLSLDHAVSSTDSAAVKINNNNNINNSLVGAPPAHAHAPFDPSPAPSWSLGINIIPPPSTTVTTPLPISSPAPATEPTKLSLDAFFPSNRANLADLVAPAPASAAPAPSYPGVQKQPMGFRRRPWEKANRSTSTQSPVLNNVNVNVQHTVNINVPAVGAHSTQQTIYQQQQPISLSLANMMPPETKSESSSTPKGHPHNVGHPGAASAAGAGQYKKGVVSLESMLGRDAYVNKIVNGDTPTITTPTTSGSPRGATNTKEVTTMMIRNLPKEVTQSQLLELLNDTGYKAQYDFVYLPCCFTKNTNIGYAFVNFLSRTVAYDFRDTWQNSSFFHKEIPGREPPSTVNVTVAQVQGKEMNIQRLIHVCRCSKITNPKYQPVVYEHGVRVNFLDYARKVEEAGIVDDDKVLRQV